MKGGMAAVGRGAPRRVASAARLHTHQQQHEHWHARAGEAVCLHAPATSPAGLTAWGTTRALEEPRTKLELALPLCMAVAFMAACVCESVRACVRACVAAYISV